MVDTTKNNLNGQLTPLKSALSEAAISLGEQLVLIINEGVFQKIKNPLNQ